MVTKSEKNSSPGGPVYTFGEKDRTICLFGQLTYQKINEKQINGVPLLLEDYNCLIYLMKKKSRYLFITLKSK